MSDLPSILSTIRDNPDGVANWLILAGWFDDHEREDEAADIRVFWPSLRDNVRGEMSVDEAVAEVTRNARLLGQLARQVEQRRLAAGR